MHLNLILLWVLDEEQPIGRLFEEFIASLLLSAYVLAGSSGNTYFVVYIREEHRFIYKEKIYEQLRILSFNVKVQFRGINTSRSSNPYLSKVSSIHQALNHCKEYSQDPWHTVLYLDCDCLIINNFIYQLVEVLNNSSYDCALSLECGALDNGVITNYNTGVIALRPNFNTLAFLENWMQAMLEISETNEVIGDQIVFRQVLFRNHALKVLTLHDTCNLRCHPVFNGSSYVWSPVCLIHNHNLVHLTYKLLIMLSRVSTEYWEYHNPVMEVHTRLLAFFNPPENPFKPRLISISSSAIVNHFFDH